MSYLFIYKLLDQYRTIKVGGTSAIWVSTLLRVVISNRYWVYDWDGNWLQGCYSVIRNSFRPINRLFVLKNPHKFVHNIFFSYSLSFRKWKKNAKVNSLKVGTITIIIIVMVLNTDFNIIYWWLKKSWLSYHDIKEIW